MPSSQTRTPAGINLISPGKTQAGLGGAGDQGDGGPDRPGDGTQKKVNIRKIAALY
jgi:hypothetical protein